MRHLFSTAIGTGALIAASLTGGAQAQAPAAQSAQPAPAVLTSSATTPALLATHD